MNARTRVMTIAAVAILAVLNLWRWTGGAPAPTAHRSSMGPGREPSADDLVLRVSVAVQPQSETKFRDLFHPKLLPVKRVARTTPPPPPPKTPEQLAEEQARAELAAIKLLGVVFRGALGEAFLLTNSGTVTAQAGSRVGNRFVVERITPESVDLRDPETQVSGQLALVEKESQ